MVDPDATGPSEGKSKSRWEKISDLLKGEARLEKAAPPVLAQNLGLMAKRLDPDDPKGAARRMFERALGKTSREAWSKRKRLVRLPGEEAPRFDRHGDYEAGGRNYVKLAEAYAEIRSPSSKDERDHAIRFLTRGTSFNPVRDSYPNDQEGVDRAIEELRNRLSDPLIQSNIAKCFSYNRYLPIRNDGGFVSIFVDEMDNIVGRESYLISSLSPRVKVGKIFLPIDSPCVSIGATDEISNSLDAALIEDAIDENYDFIVRSGVSPSDAPAVISAYALERSVSKKIAQRLEELDVPPNLFSYSTNWSDWFHEHDPHQIHSLRKYRIYAERSVSIVFIEAITEGNVEPAILVAHDDETSFDNFVLKSGDTFVDFTNNFGVVDCLDDAFQYRLVDIDGEAIAVGHFERLTDLREEKWPEIDGVYKLDDPAASDLMMIGSDRECLFEPTVWDDRSLFATAPQTSMVATILRNLAYAHANGADGLDDLIFADAEKRLNPVLEFYEDQRAAFDDAMDGRVQREQRRDQGLNRDRGSPKDAGQPIGDRSGSP